MTIYLYVKTHNKTGLKYLGKTIKQDPHKYAGSGKYWRRHLDCHGYDYSTEIIKECQSNIEIQEWGMYYSKLWNIVESNEWANLKPEKGDGGSGFKHSNETRKKMSKSQTGKEHSEESKSKMRGRKLSDETRRKIGDASRRRLEIKYGKTYEQKPLRDIRLPKPLVSRAKSEETRKKMSDAKKGKILTEVHKQNISKAKKQNNINTG